MIIGVLIGVILILCVVTTLFAMLASTLSWSFRDREIRWSDFYTEIPVTLLEVFDCRFLHIDPENREKATVEIVAKNGDVFYGTYTVAKLNFYNVYEGDVFTLKTIGVDKCTKIKIEKKKRKILTEAELQEIEDEINKALPPEDPGVEY